MNIAISDAERVFLINLVDIVLRTAVAEGRLVNEGELPAIPEGILREKMGAFVSYFVGKGDREREPKELRGCIGAMDAQNPLWVTVVNMAYYAAREDSRFMPISKEELDNIYFDITVLSPFSVCPNKDEIILGKHGVMLEMRGRRAVFLPQVAVEQGWSLQETFENLCRKANLPDTAWQEKDAVFYWYEGLVLHM